MIFQMLNLSSSFVFLCFPLSTLHFFLHTRFPASSPDLALLSAGSLQGWSGGES